MSKAIFFCAGRNPSLDHLLRGSGVIGGLVRGQVLRLGCDVGPGQDRGTAITMRVETGDCITGVDMILTRGVCQDGIGTESGSKIEKEKAEIATALVAAAEAAAVAVIV